MGLYFTNPSKTNLVGYADAGYRSDPHIGRSQTGYVFTLAVLQFHGVPQPLHLIMQKFWRSMKQAENVFG
jgi:hypothetical protein